MTDILTVDLGDHAFMLNAVTACDSSFNTTLRNSAREITDRVFGREVYLRGLVEFSNICKRNCQYCGLYSGNTGLERYRMTKEEILERARLIKLSDFGTIVLQSGEDAWYTADVICEIVRSVKEETGLAITLSIGEWLDQDYRRFREAGADRFLLRHETANADLYAKLHPGHTLEERVACLRAIKRCGYEVGSGFMVGLPGQQPDDLIEDLKMLVDLEVDMAGIGPYVENPDTPLAGSGTGDVEVVLNLIALLRHLMPGLNIPATTALDSLREDGRELGLAAGANVVMPVMTPPGHKEQYRLYPNKRCLTHNPVACVGCTRNRLEKGGYFGGTGPGWSKQEAYRKGAVVS